MLRSAPSPAPRQPQRPVTVACLLRQLGIQHACALEQRAVLAQWLKSNTATPELKVSLRANGYGLLLPRPRRRLSPAHVHLIAPEVPRAS